MTTSQTYSKRILEALIAKDECAKWETFIVKLLRKLELDEAEREQAVACYEELGRHVAKKMGLNQTDADVFVQGSMRTQTTISPRGNQNFDLDVVVKISSQRFNAQTDSQTFFDEFGESLKGIEGAGEPEPKRRCWRLSYPGQPFYFEVTPALPGSISMGYQTDLRVRDPETVWSPSNPEDFANWFCEIAAKRFHFQNRLDELSFKSQTEVSPVPSETVGIDDILRRGIQLIKLHRDNYYWALPKERKDAQPISVILVTLAGNVYNQMVVNESLAFNSPIEVLLEMVDRMPLNLQRNTKGWLVPNPKLGTENFADRWNSDGGLRCYEFHTWHKKLSSDLETLFTSGYQQKTKDGLKTVFGQKVVDDWASSLATPLQGLLATVAGLSDIAPASARPQGSKNTLA